MASKEEHDRFLTLFEWLVSYTDAWIERMPPEKLDWVPIQTGAMRFGDRVSRVIIQGLITHAVVGEAYWAQFVRDSPDGATMPLPSYLALAEEFKKRDFRELARKSRAKTLAALRGYALQQLDKHVIWVGGAFSRPITRIATFRLGSVDIYLRHADVVVPEFFEFNPRQMA